MESKASALIIKNITHPQTIVNVDNVTAQDSWLQLWHTKHSPLPHVTHARDDVVSPDRSELLVKLFGAAVCPVNVLGNDGSFRNDDPRAGVLELSINAYVFSFTITLPAYASGHGNTAVGNKHAGDSLLFCSCNWGLRGSRKGWIRLLSHISITFISQKCVNCVDLITMSSWVLTSMASSTSKYRLLSAYWWPDFSMTAFT